MSCDRDDCSDPVPSIAFNSFTIIGDSAELVHDFVDCDGDIGLGSEEIDPPFDPDGEYHFNLKVDLLAWTDNQWQVVEPDSGVIGLNARIRPINEETQEETIEGKIRYNIWLPEIQIDDSIRFRTSLIDRALNESTKEISPTIVFPN